MQCAYAPRCMVCVPNQPSVCITCASGFYLNSNSSCSACPLFCSTCTSASTCTSLLTPIGYSIATVNGQSVLGVCDPGCYSCSQNNPSSCTVCIPGFYLMTASNSSAKLGVCTPCNSNCMYCVIGQPNNCTACFAGANFNAANSTCSNCAFPCITCSTSTFCTSCPSGYSLSVSGVCTQITSNSTCGDNCGTCVQASSGANPMCINCLAGFVLANGFCVLCPAACSVCTLNQNTLTGNQPTCSACNVGNFLNKQSLTCQSCSTGCGACFNSTVCLTCVQGYSLTSIYSCIVRCVYPCSTCSSTNATMCTNCVDGYTLTGMNCTSNVATCNAGANCTVCPFGYNLFTNGTSQKCVACDTNSNCARCNPVSTGVCTSCAYGAYLTNNICQACSTGCSNCLDLNTCFRCYPMYVALLPATMVTGSSTSPLLIDITSKNNIIYQPVTCKPCISPCVTCISSTTSCLSCISGYNISGTSCVSMFNYGAMVVLNTDPTTFVQNYYSFLSNISSSIGQAINTITVSSIVYGSATVSFTVSTSNSYGSNGATTLQTNLQNTISGQSIAGLPVTKSTLTVNGAPSDNGGSSTSNTTLIIAIVIPIASLSTFPFI